MSRRPRNRVGRRALRVAALATSIVAGIVIALCVGTDIIVAHTLTSSVDGRLVERMSNLEAEATPAVILQGSPPDHDHDFDQPVVAWLVVGGRVVTGRGAPALPSTLRGVGAAVTATMAGTSFRVAGTNVGNGHLVVATSLASVSETVDDAVAGEVVLGGLLLLVAFAGALVIGRRVATPFEEMRQRQLAFTADASHELRTPLGVIEAEVSLALTSKPQLGVYREALEQIAGESGRMRRLVEDLLWLARLDDEPPPPTAEPVDVGAAACATAERFRAVATGRELQLRVEAPDGIAAVDAPPEWVDRLTGVLIDNACKYSPAGGAVTVTVAERGGRVHLSVSDQGEGIAPAERERIFDRFHRATSTGEGAGLGLAIADAIVRATRGRWEVAAGAGGTGSRFTVIWPRAAR